MAHAARPGHRYSFEDYLAVERASTIRHEYLDGEIYAMAGGTPEHAALSMAVGTALSNSLRGGPCRVFSSDLGVRVRATGLATYPDATVVCGSVERDPESRFAVTNPSVLVEVTSEATEDYDRGEKLEHYQQIPALRACVFVSHREARIDVIYRMDNGNWGRAVAGAGESAELPGIGCSLEVDAIYGDLLRGL